MDILYFTKYTCQYHNTRELCSDERLFFTQTHKKFSSVRSTLMGKIQDFIIILTTEHDNELTFERIDRFAKKKNQRKYNHLTTKR